MSKLKLVSTHTGRFSALPKPEETREAAPEEGLTAALVRALAADVSKLVAQEIARITSTTVQPMLFNVEEAGIYLGRSKQSIQHLIFDKELPVVRVGTRVHLHRPDLDKWIEKNKY